MLRIESTIDFNLTNSDIPTRTIPIASPHGSAIWAAEHPSVEGSHRIAVSGLIRAYSEQSGPISGR
jgi:hypothetical protein